MQIDSSRKFRNKQAVRSISRRYKMSYWKGPQKKKFCPGCKRWFSPNSGKQLYCCDECHSVITHQAYLDRMETWRRAHGARNLKIKRFCPMCKTWYIPKGPSQTYCGRNDNECRSLDRKIARQKNKYDVKCEPTEWYPADPSLGSNIHVHTRNPPSGLVCPAI